MMDQFTASQHEQAITGLKILLVDEEPAYLEALGDKLRVLCKHEVVEYQHEEDALFKLMDDKDRVDIVLIGISGSLGLLDSIRSIDDQLSVLLYSDHLDMNVAEKAIRKGACDFLVKPIQDSLLLMIWQHVYRSRLGRIYNSLELLINPCSQPLLAEDSTTCFGLKRGWPATEVAHIESSSSECAKEAPSPTGAATKKLRVHWTPELNRKFEQAYERVIKRKGGKLLNIEFGELRVTPKEILKEMQKISETGLTLQHISSHLQIYRRIRKKQVDEQSNRQAIDFSSPIQYSSSPPRSSSVSSHTDISTFPMNLQAQPIDDTNFFPPIESFQELVDYDSISDDLNAALAW